MNQQTQTNGTKGSNHVEESQPGTYPCVDCGKKHDAEHLFVLKLSELAKIKAENEGKDRAYIKDPQELAMYAYCWTCTNPDLDIGNGLYTLASSMARCQADGQRHHSRKNSNSNRQQQSAVHPVIVTGAELAETVFCVACLILDKVTRVERRDAVAPGWLGCRIMEGLKRYPKDLTSRDVDRIYIGSQDLLKNGDGGFNHCHDCIETAMELLCEKARAIGYSEDLIAEEIRSWPLVGMIKGVRKAEERHASRDR